MLLTRLNVAKTKCNVAAPQASSNIGTTFTHFELGASGEIEQVATHASSESNILRPQRRGFVCL